LNLFQNLKRNQSGSAVTGFAFIFPLIIVLALIIIQFIFIAINYASISFIAENSIRLARIGYSDTQILYQANNKINNLSLIASRPRIDVQNIDLKNKNLKIVKIDIDYKILGFKAFEISTKSYAF
jgi:Flp pilus assembly protein TadG